MSDVIADGEVVVEDLGLGDPVLAFSMGGWAALHFAASHPCRALVCLDGPTNLDYREMGLRADHPGFVPDPPDPRADFASLRCPATVVLCKGPSPEEAEWMVPFRTGLADYLTRTLPQIRVEWLATGHMLILSQPATTADLINRFAGEARG